MTIFGAETHPSPHLGDEAVTLLRALLLCQVIQHADQAAECRVAVDELTGQLDSDSVLEREIAEASASRFDAAVREAEDALRRLDDGTYGICERCSAPIPYERLRVIPHARMCVTCPGGPAALLA